jgi:hypothetical protein
MRKTLVCAFVWLALTVLCGGGSLFAGGAMALQRTEQSRVAEVSDVAEVADQEYPIRQNPSVKVASGNVYAVPAKPLSPELERLPPPVYAISGVKGVEISETSRQVVDIIVNLPETEKFSRGILEGEDVSDWITNLPEGLEARAHRVRKGATSVNIFVSGTPVVTAKTQVVVTIPGTFLEGGAAREFKSPTQEESLDSWQKSQTE